MKHTLIVFYVMAFLCVSCVTDKGKNDKIIASNGVSRKKSYDTVVNLCQFLKEHDKNFNWIIKYPRSTMTMENISCVNNLVDSIIDMCIKNKILNMMDPLNSLCGVSDGEVSEYISIAIERIFRMHPDYIIRYGYQASLQQDSCIIQHLIWELEMSINEENLAVISKEIDSIIQNEFLNKRISKQEMEFCKFFVNRMQYQD